MVDIPLLSKGGGICNAQVIVAGGISDCTERIDNSDNPSEKFVFNFTSVKAMTDHLYKWESNEVDEFSSLPPWEFSVPVKSPECDQAPEESTVPDAPDLHKPQEASTVPHDSSDSLLCPMAHHTSAKPQLCGRV